MVVLELGDVSGHDAVEQGDGSVDGAGECDVASDGALAALLLGEIPVEHGAFDAMGVSHEAIRQVAGGVEGADGADACAEVASLLVSGAEFVDDAGLHGVAVGALGGG